MSTSGPFNPEGIGQSIRDSIQYATRRAPQARYYTLSAEGHLLAEPDPLKWTLWMHHSAGRVAKYDVVLDVEVSTVFTGVSTSDVVTGGIWETAVRIPGEAWTSYKRYDTREQAIDGHNALVQIIRGGRAIRIREEEAGG